jgi:pimeloyl-ACP methyl ester carboxylesterase
MNAMRRGSFITMISLAATWLAASAAPLRAELELGSLCDRISNQTLGGVSYWGDELFFHDWRIQRHVSTGECRLLDGQNVRHASGTFDQCAEKLAAIRLERNLAPMSGRAAILLHGLGGCRPTMVMVASELEAHGYKVFNVGYPSTHADLARHARTLASIVAHLDGMEEIHFIGHSLGNLVIRHYLADSSDPATGRTPDPRIKRIVMIAPPNHGAEKARELGNKRWYSALLGPSGLQLGVEWPSLEPRLATPNCEFGIIAGGKGDDEGYSKKLPGDDDGLITVSTTMLAGASDSLVLPCRHTMLLFDKTACECTRRFLDRGAFRSPRERHPVLQGSQ